MEGRRPRRQPAVADEVAAEGAAGPRHQLPERGGLFKFTVTVYAAEWSRRALAAGTALLTGETAQRMGGARAPACDLLVQLSAPVPIRLRWPSALPHSPSGEVWLPRDALLLEKECLC